LLRLLKTVLVEKNNSPLAGNIDGR